MSVATVELDLTGLGEAYLKAAKPYQRRVVICAGTGCMANGAMKVFETLRAEAREARRNAQTPPAEAGNLSSRFWAPR